MSRESSNGAARRLATGVAAAALAGASVTFLAYPGAASSATSSPTRYDRVFGNIYFKVPAGYRAAQEKSGVFMVPEADLKAGTTGRFFIITPGIPLGSSMQEQFKAAGRKSAIQAIAISVGNLLEDPKASLSDPQSCNNPDKDGYECYTLFSKSVDKAAGGQTRFAQYLILLTGARADIVMRVAYESQDKYEALTNGFSALAASIEPANGRARPPARLAPPLPVGLAAITPKVAASPPQPASPRPGGRPAQSASRGAGTCRIVTRQKCSFSNGFSPGVGSYTCLPYPQRICS